jgi:hypothetical protein
MQVSMTLVLAVMLVLAGLPASLGSARIPPVAATPIAAERLPAVDAVVWASPRGTGEVLWVALEPDWRPVRVAEADAVWGVVSPDGRQIIAQLCAREEGGLRCEHRAGPLDGPLRTVGTCSYPDRSYADVQGGPREDRYRWGWGHGGAVSRVAGFSPDSAWMWWFADAPDGTATVAVRRSAEPNVPAAATAYSSRAGTGSVSFSRDSNRVYIHSFVEGSRPHDRTAVLALDRPGLPVTQLDGHAQPLTSDGRLALSWPGDGTVALVRSDGTALPPRDGAGLRWAAALERGVVLVQTRDGRQSVSLYDPASDQQTLVFNTDPAVVPWRTTDGAVETLDRDVEVVAAPDGRTFVILADAAEQPPEAVLDPYTGPVAIRREARLFSSAGELLEDFGPAVYRTNEVAVLFAQSGRRLLIARPDGDSLVLDLDTGRRQHPPSRVLHRGVPPAWDLAPDGTLWATDPSHEQARAGVWADGDGFREVAPGAFMSLSPSGKYAMIGQASGTVTIATTDGGADWSLPPSTAVGWAGDSQYGRRVLFGQYYDY